MLTTLLHALGEAFQLRILVAALLCGAGGLLIGLLARAIKGYGATSLLVGVECLVTVTLGAFLAWAFMRFWLALAGDTVEAAWFFGTAFLLWPGIINLIYAGVRAVFDIPGDVLLLGVDQLPWVAFGVGAGVGLFDGYRRIHRWLGWGALTFLADVTWGLALSVNALLIHLINFPRLFKVDPVDGRMKVVHDDMARQGTHVYPKGMALRDGFAFTQGSAISNLERSGAIKQSDPEYRDMYFHESTHVFQNRAFGPFFWALYVGWLIPMAIVGFLVSIFAGQRKPVPGVTFGNDFVFWWSYMNNPFEVWAYTYNPYHRKVVVGGWVDQFMCWPPAAVIAVAVPVYAATLAGIVLLIVAVFNGL